MALVLVIFLQDSLAASQATPKSDASPTKGQSEEDLRMAKRICYHNDKLSIQSIEKMKSLLSVINLDEKKCRWRYMSAIYELDPILNLERDKLCDESSFDRIKDYNFRFI